MQSRRFFRIARVPAAAWIRDPPSLDCPRRGWSPGTEEWSLVGTIRDRAGSHVFAVELWPAGHPRTGANFGSRPDRVAGRSVLPCRTASALRRRWPEAFIARSRPRPASPGGRSTGSVRWFRR
jgi:hypothetical protein